VRILQLTGGQLVVINAKLVKKQRFHFTTLQGLDVDIIAGLNGLIWVSPHVERMDDGTPIHQQQQSQQQQQGNQAAAELVDSAAAVAAAAAASQGPSKEQREAVVRVAGAIRALAALMLQVYPGSIIEAYQVSSSDHLEALGSVPLQLSTRTGAAVFKYCRAAQSTELYGADVACTALRTAWCLDHLWLCLLHLLCSSTPATVTTSMLGLYCRTCTSGATCSQRLPRFDNSWSYAFTT
jgi:hypothetical protein